MLSPVSPTFRSPKCRRFVIEPRPTSDVWRSIDGGAFSVQDGAAGHSPEFKPAVANIKGYKKWWLVCHYIGLSQSTGRRKFRSQTSDNTDRGGKSQRREEKRRRKKTLCFSNDLWLRRSKSRLAKAAGVEPSGQRLRAVVAQTTFPSQNAKSTSASEHFWKLRCRNRARRCGAKQICKSKCTKHILLGPLLEVEMSKKWTPLWRSTCPSQNAQSTPGSEYFWKLRCRNRARRCGAKQICKSKCTKHILLGPLLEVEMSKKRTPLWRSTCPSQNAQSTPGSEYFWKLRCRKSARRCGAKHMSKSKCLKHHMLGSFLKVQMWLLRGRRKGFCILPKVSKAWGFVAFPKTMAGVEHLKRIWQRCISRGRRSTKDMFIRDVRRSGRCFPERGCIWNHQIFRFARMILRDRCSTSHDRASLFRGRRSTSDRWNVKIAKHIGTRPSALHSIFHFWRKSRTIASFLVLSSLKNEEVSQNSFVFDVVTLQNKGCLAELLRFWRCHAQTLRKSRRIPAFWRFKVKLWGNLIELQRFRSCQV